MAEINRKAKYAWAQYFRAIREANEEMRDMVVQVREVTKTEIPDFAISTMQTLIDKYKHHIECAICFEEFAKSEEIDILIGCGHMFCKSCIIAHKSQCADEGRAALCPVCRKRI